MTCPGYCQHIRSTWVEEARAVLQLKAAIKRYEATAISPEDALEYARELRADLVARLAAVDEEIGMLEGAA